MNVNNKMYIEKSEYLARYSVSTGATSPDGNYRENGRLSGHLQNGTSFYFAGRNLGQKGVKSNDGDRRNSRYAGGGGKDGSGDKITQRRLKRKKIMRFINVLIFISVCLAITVVGGKTIFNYITDPIRLIKPPAVDGPGADEEIMANFNKDVINIVLMGFDRKEARDAIYTIYRPDTIMVDSLNLKTSDVALVSLPRDMYVKIHAKDVYDKLNHSYMYGHQNNGIQGDPHERGIESTLKTIEYFLGGVPIHYYVTVDMDAVVEIVDIVGGIHFDVDVAVRDERGYGKIIIEEGYQLLSGRRFVDYVRFRALGGDIGRMERQQNILVEAFSQVKQKGKLTQAPMIFGTINNNVETDLTLTQLGALANFGLKVDPASIRTYTFIGEGQFSPRGGLDIYYMVMDEKKRVEMIKEVFGVWVPTRTQIVLPGRRPAPVEPDPYEEVFEPTPDPIYDYDDDYNWDDGIPDYDDNNGWDDPNEPGNGNVIPDPGNDNGSPGTGNQDSNPGNLNTYRITR